MVFILGSRHLEAGIKSVNVPSPLGVEAPEEFKHRKEMMKPVDEVCWNLAVYCGTKSPCVKEVIFELKCEFRYMVTYSNEHL